VPRIKRAQTISQNPIRARPERGQAAGISCAARFLGTDIAAQFSHDVAQGTKRAAQTEEAGRQENLAACRGEPALLESFTRDASCATTVPENRVARRYFVSGMVQGVGYRFFAIRTAERLGLAGFAKNLRDGRVEVYAIGPPDKLSSLGPALKKGPSSASVDNVSEEDAEIDPQFAERFSIEYNGW